MKNFLSVARMRFTRLCALILLSALAFNAGAFAATAKKKTKGDSSAKEGSYRGYIVIDADTGKTLLEENPDVVTPPASVTKLMTFLLVSDALKAGTITLQTPVQVAAEDAKIGGTQVWLDPREKFPVEELLYAMMIQSANDAANALARTVGGTRTIFVEKMNARARELGMTHTTFRSPHGLPPTGRKLADSDLTTPSDLAILSRELVTHTEVLKYSSVSERMFGEGVRAKPVKMENHNHLLEKVTGVDGLKTGFSDGAEYCLSATAQRNGRRVIVVILGATGPGGQRDYGRARDIKAIDLLERGFNALPAAAPASAPAQPKPSSPVSPIQSNASPVSPVTSPVAPAPTTTADTAEHAVKFEMPPAKKK